jgi:hypothetical protein
MRVSRKTAPLQCRPTWPCRLLPLPADRCWKFKCTHIHTHRRPGQTMYVWRQKGYGAACCVSLAQVQFGNKTQNLIPTAPLAATWFTALNSVTNPSTGVDHKGILVFSTDCTSVYLLKLFQRPWMTYRSKQGVLHFCKAHTCCAPPALFRWDTIQFRRNALLPSSLSDIYVGQSASTVITIAVSTYSSTMKMKVVRYSETSVNFH